MSDLIPFEDGSVLPSYAKAKATNSDLTAHAGQGYPILSIKGKRWAVVRDGQRETIRSPKDPEAAASYIEVVLVKSSPKTSKVFYAKGYDPNAGENVKPDCFSNNGETPDPLVENPVCRTCATCPNNQWGSKITESGKKGKQCADSVRVAVAAVGTVEDPMLLRVPAASIRALGDFGDMMSKRGVDYRAVVTRLSFDEDEATPKLVLKPVNFVDEATYNRVVKVSESELVSRMLGLNEVKPLKTVEAVTTEVIEKAKETVKVTGSEDKKVTDKEVEKSAAAGVKKAAAVDIAKMDLDDINFDD